MESIPLQKDDLTELRKGNNTAIKEIYKSNFSYCTTFIVRNGGSQDDAREIYQRSMVIFLEKLQDEAFELTSNIKKYLSGICRNQWLKELKRRGKMEELGTEQDGPPAKSFGEDSGVEEEAPTRLQLIFKYLNAGSASCKQLLLLTFFNKLPDKEIAPVMNYSLEFVRNKRRRCINSIRKRINQTHG